MGSVANGTTVTFGSLFTGLTDIKLTEDGQPVEITNLSSTEEEYAINLPKRELTLTVFGINTTALGTVNDLTIAWADGTSRTLASRMLSSKSQGAPVKGAMTTEMTFVKAAV